MQNLKTFIGFDLLMDQIKEKYNPSTESLKLYEKQNVTKLN